MGRSRINRKPKQSQPLPSLSKNADRQQVRMPSASAKIEKLASSDAADPVKQFTITLEKKVRNLEKRKQKLDNYRSDVENGKELNEDQKLAVSKYESVVEVLEYSKELCKSLTAIIQESTRIQKKLAKKEQIERQQHEIQRLQEAFCYKHILSCLENEDVRNDLSNGENGAPKVSPEDLTHLDQFYKLIGPTLPNDQGEIESHFHALAENLIFLVDGKNKDVVGTTYKALKELLHNMKESGYFTKSLDSGEDVSTADEMPDHEDTIINETKKMSLSEDIVENGDSNYSHSVMSSEVAETNTAGDADVALESELPDKMYPAVAETDAPKEGSCSNQNGSLQDVLSSSEGNFNFLQESQIELDTPHMDPAVVAVHQVTPPSAAMNFSQGAPHYQQVQTNNVEHVSTVTQEGQQEDQPEQQLPGPGIPPAVQRNVQPVLASAIQHSDFDPNHPIPTQTYTNQSYAVMQHVIIPPYVPVTMHHAPLQPHMAPMPVSLSPPASTQSSNVVPMHITMAPAAVVTNSVAGAAALEELTPKCDADGEAIEEHSGMNGNMSGSEMVQTNGEKNDDSEGFTVQNSYQRGYRGRGRGRSSVGGYYRGRGNYNRGGYQNYYNGGGNYRRGGPRGGRSNGNARGNRGGSFRSQQTQQQQQHQ